MTMLHFFLVRNELEVFRLTSQLFDAEWESRSTSSLEVKAIILNVKFYENVFYVG